MKKLSFFSLYLLHFASAYSQSGVVSDCKSNIENIFKVHDLKIKYEAVLSLFEEIEKKRRFPKDSYFLNSYFELITGFPLASEKQSDSISSINHSELLKVEWLSEEEMYRYIKQINCTPEEAFIEYRVFIQNVKHEKEIYLKCIDVEIAKGDVSEYAKDNKLSYDFKPPYHSLIPPDITRLDFLKIFKEFIINDNEEVLPDGVRVHAFLKCGCKIPYAKSGHIMSFFSTQMTQIK